MTPWRVDANEFPNGPDKTEHNRRWIYLLTPEELRLVPDGMVLVSIGGREIIKGRDMVPTDTRGGHLAYGLVSRSLANRLGIS